MSDSEEKVPPQDSKRNVVITGFGLFRDHQSNPSWDALKDGQLKVANPNVNVVVKRITVSYEEVDDVVPKLWSEYNPILMIHVGLAAMEKGIRIEAVARHGPYLHDDIVKHAPHKHLRKFTDTSSSLEEGQVKHCYTCEPHDDFGCSKTCLNIDKICEKMNAAYKAGKIGLPSSKSEDAGLYVCEYIYHASLKICDRTVFIHVPDTKNFKLQDIRQALEHAIELLIDEAIAIAG